MAGERGFSLISASANGESGTVISALAFRQGMYYAWATGHSAMVWLYGSPDGVSWLPITGHIIGAASADAASGSGLLSANYGYLRHVAVSAYSAGDAKGKVTTFIQMVP